uniref:Regulator of G-protein signaling 8 n=1 Tax=Cyanistes caeruleus TaxID=156563 RepID=A0A8C0VII0_CYACU
MTSPSFSRYYIFFRHYIFQILYFLGIIFSGYYIFQILYFSGILFLRQDIISDIIFFSGILFFRYFKFFQVPYFFRYYILHQPPFADVAFLCNTAVPARDPLSVLWAESGEQDLSRDTAETWQSAAPRVSPADGLAAFRAFLKTEFSEENLEFWLACEDFKKTRSAAKLASKAQRIFEEFIDVQAPREVNIDFQTRELTRRNVQEPSLSCFDQAQGKVHSLMEKDSYPRFLRSKIYTDLLSQTQRRLS